MSMDYELLVGRGGATGVIRSENGGRKLTAQGLYPGADMAAYLLIDGRARKIAAGKGDERGRWDALLPREGKAFAAADGKVILYPAGDRPEEGYALACTALKRLRAPKTEIAEKKPVPPPAPADEQAAEPIQPAASEEDHYTLRKPSDGAPVDDLPVLHWPRGTEDIRAYFDALPPMAPFENAPGWRFVRLPSPLPGVAYCALGRYAQNDQVKRLAYALPGMPQRPPTVLPGYRYRPGRNGMGYWVAEQNI